MARRIPKTEEKTDINISPMIDMVFILLIFFIVTTVFVDERGIEADKPQPSNEPTEDDNEEPIRFHITANGQVEHKRDGNTENVSLDRVGSIVENLRSQFDVPVILEVEREALAGVMVRVMDASYAADPDVKITVQNLD